MKIKTIRKIVVTGGAGFIGREVVIQLLAKGYGVIVVDKKPASSMIDIKHDNLKYYKCDLTKNVLLDKIFKKTYCCIHLAGESGGIGFLRKNPATIISNNSKMYNGVFSAAVRAKIERIVFISSSMVFEMATKFPVREVDIDTVGIPKSAYSLSKLMGEGYCQSFYEQYGLKYTICRPSNAYGLNSDPVKGIGQSHVIPDLVKKVISTQYPIEILGNGKQTRCFTHISDIARGIIIAMESRRGVNEDFNLTSTKETSIRDLAEMIFKVLRPDIPFKVKLIKGYTFDVKRNLLSNEKAKKILYWQPEKVLEKEIIQIVMDFRRNISRT